MKKSLSRIPNFDGIHLYVGRHYLVKHGKNFVRRIFKGTEWRFGNIPCFVFTSKITASTTMKKKGANFYYTGPFPVQEISIPMYEIVDIRKIYA